MRGPDEPRELRPLDVQRFKADEVVRVPRPGRRQRADWRRAERQTGKVMRR